MVARVLRAATHLAPNALPAHRAAVDYLARRMERPVDLVLGGADDDVVRGRVDLAFLCGLPYVHLAARWPGTIAAIAAPVLRGTRHAGRPIYFSDVIVRREDPAQTLPDLVDRVLAVNGRDSFSGWLALRGPISPARWVQLQVRETGSHEASLGAVCDGAADWAAIDSQVLATEVRSNPRLAARLRVIASIGPAPAPPVVVSLRLAARLRNELLRALVDCAADGQARRGLLQGGIERFVPVTDQHYDSIRAAAAAVDREGALPV